MMYLFTPDYFFTSNPTFCPYSPSYKTCYILTVSLVPYCACGIWLLTSYYSFVQGVLCREVGDKDLPNTACWHSTILIESLSVYVCVCVWWGELDTLCCVVPSLRCWVSVPLSPLTRLMAVWCTWALPLWGQKLSLQNLQRWISVSRRVLPETLYVSLPHDVLGCNLV